MEAAGPFQCVKCGKSFTETELLTSHPCSEKHTTPPSKKQMKNYKCSQCTEVFSKPGELRSHFKNTHSGLDPKGPFSCTEQSCTFSSTQYHEYQAHLMSEHGLTLIPCTLHSCKVAFLTRDEMETHLQGHMPFGCFQCQFVCQSVKYLNVHLLQHSDLSVCTQGNNTKATAVCTSESPQPQGSNTSKRKHVSNPGSSLTEEENEDQPEIQRQNMKQVRMAVEKDKAATVDPAPLPSKEYLAEGSEHIYRTHTCPKCRRCFKMRSHLQEHLHLHFPDPNLQCPTCKRYFTSKSKLRLHRLREAGHKLHRCHLCQYSAVEQNAIRRHLASVHAGEVGDGVNAHSYPCPTCGQSFGQSKSLKAHMKTHNILQDSKPVVCFYEGCTFQTSLRKDLLRHTSEVHGVRAVECRHHACGAVFQSEKDMEAHHRTHLAYHCSDCDFSCSNKSVFLQHRRLGHSGTDKLSCDFCSFFTFNPVVLEQHVGHLHANEKIHRCPQCSYMTSHKRGLKRHMLMHSGEKPHKCNLCDFRCRDESYLSKHMLTHSDDKNFMCAECGYVTKWKHYLNVHMRKHTGDLRYKCDQCSYHCHRMDQLNSHKLRHQAKSLMCEICAYACKRKYELRNHMLAKHSGEEKAPSVFKCKYCAYTTCHKQALQNHENCKHTRLKEYRCALCFYSSFSSISLFLHKRKAHGYIPGDKAWLEHYAAKEKERNPTQFLQEFYNKPHKQSGLSISARPQPSRGDQVDLPVSADHIAVRDSSVASQAEGSVDVFDVVSQEVASESISEAPISPSSSPEEYCTLVLTTLPATDYQTPTLENEVDNCTNGTPSSLNFNISQEKAEQSRSSSEEDHVALADDEENDLDDNDVRLTTTNQPTKPGGCHPQATESENDLRTISSTFPPEPDLRLKAMKKHDRDQAEAMVMEGRVQMLVVPTKDVYRCDMCSYVTAKESALTHHCKSLCQGRVKGHMCKACGAKFKQKRGLESHLAKKCAALPRKTRTFVGVTNARLATDEGEEGSEQNEGSSLQANISTESHKQREGEEGTISSGQNRNKYQIKRPKHARGEAESEQFFNDKLTDVPLHSLYTEKDGRFKCNLCSFSSVKLATIERHLSACRKQSQELEIVSEMEDDCGEELAEEREDLKKEMSDRGGKVSKKHQTFSCPHCAFKCTEKRALDTHERKGCLKPVGNQCTKCSFLAKSQLSVTRHLQCAHNKKKVDVAAAKRLHCEHCAFTCKQERCMKQHVALKHKGARPHQCRYCPFRTTRRYRLEEHESLHTGVGRHNCDLCEKTFGAVTKLRQHKIRIHDKQPKHFCSLCDFSGFTQDDVRRHSLRCHMGELHHICTHCQAQFSSEVALRNHCKRVHQPQLCFTCKQCDYTCSSETTLKAHQETRHPEMRCTTCQESFKTKQSLEIHQKTHLAHQCQLCPFAARTRQLLAQHLLNEHEEGSAEEKPLKCSACGFFCRHQLVLEQHLRSHGGKRLYKCTDCEYSTCNKQKITWHIRIHTGEKPYNCEQCSYTCTDPSRLKLHMRVHQEEKKYLCPECGYKCKWATQLKYHMTKHTGDKPYACDECDYRTNRADALRAHRDTQHCDMRPYVCEKCGKAFKTSFILKTHQRQHSDDRPYICGLCSKAFRWPAGLRHHYLSHTKQQPFCCRHCSYRAKQKFQVVKHLQRHHPEQSVEQGVVRDSEAGGLTLKEALQGTLGESAAEVEDRGASAKVQEEAVQRPEDCMTKS